MAEKEAATVLPTILGQRRSRHLPAHLQDYQVNLPQALLMSKPLSASTPELRSSSGEPAYSLTGDQLPAVLGHQMRLDQRTQDVVGKAELSALSSQLSGDLGRQHFQQEEGQHGSEADSKEDGSLSVGSIKFHGLPHSSHTPAYVPRSTQVSSIAWDYVPPSALRPGLPVSTLSPVYPLVSLMSYTSPQALAPAAGGSQYIPQTTYTSWSQPLIEQRPITSQTLQLPLSTAPAYQIPIPAPTSSILTQPAFVPASATSHLHYGAPTAAAQQVSQLLPTWSSTPYALPHNVAGGLAPPYLPAQAVTQPLQPSYHLPYPPAQAATQPLQPSYHLSYPPQYAAAHMQLGSTVSQPMVQSFTTAPPLPMQPVPVLALPKLRNNSEREFTDVKMALDHLLNPHAELSEHYKYRVLMEQLVLEEARLIAHACRHHAQPYTAAMQALQQEFGQPHQLAQGEIAAILNSPEVKAGDFKAFQSFALRVDLLVGMLTILEGPNGLELTSTGHVDRLLSKLPRNLRDSFIEHLQVRGRLRTQGLNLYNLRDLAGWMKVKAEAQRLSSKLCQRIQTEKPLMAKRDKNAGSPKQRAPPVTIYHGSDTSKAEPTPLMASTPPTLKTKKYRLRVCLFCKSNSLSLTMPDDCDTDSRSVRDVDYRG
ncbi:uncharacterized protein LOC114573602 [Perca flavescens]|uniref:uncharacterized protein LOC114573602 n=1 Tax=Perca flavescens TaxID=8167 RepID=UPI00106EB40D|nr:uncharacterized protein LOC114573602 [Perca flavescens]